MSLRVTHAILGFCAAFFLNGTGSALAQDIDGAEDHPMIQRYPGQTIAWQQIENFMPYKVPAGPVTGYRQIEEMIETAGRVTRTFYVYEGTDRTHTEIWKNYSDALKEAGFEILGEGVPTTRPGQNEVGGRNWQQVVFIENDWNSPGAPVSMMVQGSSSQGGSGAVVATKERAAGTAYVVINVEQHSDQIVAALVDIIEVEEAETGLVSVDPEAIGKGITEYGRVVLTGLVFDFDKATLRPESDETLDAISQYLAANTDREFFVVGHTDSMGAFAYNQKLSADRARAVVDALQTRYGVAAERLESHGVGPLSPVWANETDGGREQNRRVELVEK